MPNFRQGPTDLSRRDPGQKWMLMTEPGLRVRRSNPVWMRAVERYFAVILPRLRALEYARGGPVIAMQIENEYGSYGRDKNYLGALRDLFKKYGCESALFTMDGNEELLVAGGRLPEVWCALSFGSRGVESFDRLRGMNPSGPDACMEFWHGWFDHWGEQHHTRDAVEAAGEFDAMLASGASVNLYSFAGGTNFGFHNGANGLPGEPYQPTVTSYDFDAPVSESGDLTPKFFAYQNVIRKYRPAAPFSRPADPKKIAYPAASFTGSVPLRDQLDFLSVEHPCADPEPMEFFHQAFGFIHYRTRLHGPAAAELNFLDLHDRAQVYLDGQFLGTLYRNDPATKIGRVVIPPAGATLEVVVENMGRINYGPLTGRDFKGLTGGVFLNRQQQDDWRIRPLPLDHLDRLTFGEFGFQTDHPTFHRAQLSIDEAADTFIRFPGTKGVIWVNGINLGRYWEIGPGRSLYLPGCFLSPGVNTIVVLELHRLNASALEFSDRPERG